MNENGLFRAACFAAMVPTLLTGQATRNPDPVMLKHWAAPLYWQPQAREAAAASLPANANPLVFVAMTPCRVIDTRASQGFPGAFGAPSLTAGVSRTFPIQSSTTCSIPAAAQAYSLNITVVPAPGSTGFITAYPTGQPLPVAATLVWSLGSITSNAAIVPGGANGSVDVYANNPTDLVIDINGYYAAVGGAALGVNNTALGVGALQSNTGTDNTAVGAGALDANTSGAVNTAVGAAALANNTTGGVNTAVGHGALGLNTSGNENTASGFAALGQNTTGSNNVATGDGAAANNTTGNKNVAIGDGAVGTTSGNNNIGIGFQAGINVSGGNSNNIHIGSQGASADNNTIRIGTPGTQTSFFAAGIRGISTGNNDAITVVVDSNGQLGTISSSARFKEDIQDMGDASRAILQLRPVTFRYQKPFDDGSKPVQYGLIAEEVEEVFPDLVARSADRQIETVKYQVLDSLLLNELQRQAPEIRTLSERMEKLESESR
ncbi:MAG TPA: tail fiber domain-containing protein [Bryobacteraceae bacterium]